MMAIREPLWFSQDTIDVLFPLHVRVGRSGKIRGIGPTMARVMGDLNPGSAFLDRFTIDKPRHINDVDGIRRATARKLVISGSLSTGSALQFRCVACEIAASTDLLIDFSFGENLADVMQRFHLTTTDFKPNDFSIDMLFMLESQKALLEDSQTLAAALSVAKESAEHAANVDQLTGISNRRAFNRHLSDLMTGADKMAEHALLHIDLDKFKSVNDTFGHAAGDAILQHTARALEAMITPSDLAARIGGDEFALVLRTPGPDAALEVRIRALIDEISRPIPMGKHICQVGASVGLSRFRPSDLTSPEQPLYEADIALYEAKNLASPIVFLTNEMVAQHTKVSDTVLELEDGIAARHFVPFFQPQIDLTSGRVSGFEVLARWNHPERGVLAPNAWLSIAERAGLMASIDQLVMSKAIKVFAQWRAEGLRPGKPSFNLTATNLASTNFIETLRDELLIAGISTSDVQIELLESILFDTADPVLIERCFQIHDAGFVLALDDFGTGHASIASLIEIPISILKIDRSFVTGLAENPKLQRITRSILAMSAQIGLDVVAEGVETEDELALITNYGCRYVQGFHFSRPLNATDCQDWMENYTSVTERRMSGE